MNRNVTDLYFLILNNRVVVVSSNLKDFHNELIEKYPAAKYYMYYYRKWNKENVFSDKLDGVEYIFQHLTFNQDTKPPHNGK